jgi:alpha-N-arabinofuranosidase
MIVFSILSVVAVFCFQSVLAGPKYPRSGQNVARSFFNSSVVSLNILTKTGVRNATSPELYGWMFEDINHSGDGGLYGELLANRAFDGSNIAYGTIPSFTGPNIVYQENECLATGMQIL